MSLEVFISLDFTSLSEAIKVAYSVIRAGISHLEIGTPLIKAEGVRTVKIFRELFPNVTIFADMKTMDTGALEASLAFENGADICSVMGAAPRATWREALKVADDFNGEILLDTLGVENVPWLIDEAHKEGVHRVCIHRGIDEGVLGSESIEGVKTSKLKLGAAGGINEDVLPSLIGELDFVMVGRAVTRSKDPEEAARRILKVSLSE